MDGIELDIADPADIDRVAARLIRDYPTLSEACSGRPSQLVTDVTTAVDRLIFFGCGGTSARSLERTYTADASYSSAPPAILLSLTGSRKHR
jgi:hypothetical protein